MWRWAVAALIGWLVSFAVAGAAVARQGSGAGDLSAFAFWTTPAALGLALAGHLVLPLSRRRAAFSHVVALLAGAAAGLLWTLAVALMLGPFMGAWSFPVLFCWMAGGAAAFGCFASPVLRPTRLLAHLALVVAVFLPLTLWAHAVAAFVRNDQHLRVVIARHDPDEADGGGEGLVGEIWPEPLRQIKAVLPEGTLRVLQARRQGEGTRDAQMVLVFRQPLVADADLPQPDGGWIVYVQEGRDWRAHPAGAPTLKRKVRVRVGSGQEGASYMVERADGSASGAGLWDLPQR